MFYSRKEHCSRLNSKLPSILSHLYQFLKISSIFHGQVCTSTSKHYSLHWMSDKGCLSAFLISTLDAWGHQSELYTQFTIVKQLIYIFRRAHHCVGRPKRTGRPDRITFVDFTSSDCPQSHLPSREWSPALTVQQWCIPHWKKGRSLIGVNHLG